MSKELKWCKQFMRVNNLLFHRRRKVRLKNAKRRQRMFDKAIRKWGCLPYPPEWRKNYEKRN